MMNEHTTKAFDSDLQELTRKVSEMGGLAEREIVFEVRARAVGAGAVANPRLLDSHDLHPGLAHHGLEHPAPAVARAERILDRIAGKPGNENDHRQLAPRARRPV